MCTGIRLSALDGTVVHARTLEFGVDLESTVILSPRGYRRTATTPDGQPGQSWQARYASLGADGLGLRVIVDGLNEKGLAVGLFYFPGSAGYLPYTPADAPNTVAPWELGSWILDQFASVEEVKAGIGRVVVPAVLLKAWNLELEVHYIVHDASGQSLVIEYVDNQLHIHDNPLGVFTNSPSFDWHITNLRNYVNFSTTSHEPLQLGSVRLAPLGQGSGMLGMPGDFTPPSRFVRAVAFSQSIFPAQSGREAILNAFHILNNFDIPRGAAREAHRDAEGNVLADHTIWTAASDLQARQFHFRTYANSQIRRVDLMAHDLDGDAILTVAMTGEEEIAPLTALAA